MKILVLNAGSSSQKIRLYELAGDALPPEAPPAPLWAADADWGSKPGRMTITVTARGETWTTEELVDEREKILARLLQILWRGEVPLLQQPADIELVGRGMLTGVAAD